MNMKKIISLLAISLFGVSAQAGRPLSVDDANVNDAGVAHIETFWSRAADPNVRKKTTLFPGKDNTDLGCGTQWCTRAQW
jgi:hypothetical protein